ncbi:hypothetical protein D3W54_15190 [Komagataeibacter medellinensis]|uniref:Uncharacterized protein n=1 Tax=Komagataeibacter medellinensis TaxID=1177712 RepID=A0ABQ6VRN8_9PROT|nr:hypothetical protein [Komagataeibacter medellinensis]KAB8122521.1 hypothetical protein D3W54_15190 [Komagataeibacter medellinensis]
MSTVRIPLRLTRPTPRQARLTMLDDLRRAVESGATIGLMALAVRPGGQCRTTSAGTVGVPEMRGLLARNTQRGEQP